MKQVYEKFITGYQRYTNQNYNKISLHTSQNGLYLKRPQLVVLGMWQKKSNSFTSNGSIS